jgi:hypothetical protein
MATNRAVQAVLITKDQPAITSRSAQAIVITQDPAVAQIRNVRGYALTTPSHAGQVRNVRGYVLSSALKMPSGQVGVNAMLWLLNQNVKGAAFTTAQIGIGTPSTYSDPTGRTNSQVTVSAKSGSGYAGSMQAYYSRRSITTAFSNTNWLLGTISSATTIRGLISQINSAYGTSFDPTDVVDGPVAAGTTSLVLAADPGSYVYLPGTQILLPTLALASATPNTALTGFDNAAGVGPRLVTASLLHFDGANGGTTFTDAQGRVWTANNGATLSTASPKFGTASFLNNGTSGRYISTPDSADLKLTADFTVEFFLNPTNASPSQILTTKGTGGRLILSGGAIFAYDDTGGNGMSGGSVPAGTYVHVALSKQGGTTRLFVGGSVVATSTAYGTFGNNSSNLFIGTYSDGSYPMYAYLDEYRISKFARYTANFTPPTAPFSLD